MHRSSLRSVPNRCPLACLPVLLLVLLVGPVPAGAAHPGRTAPAPELVPETPDGQLPYLVECTDPSGLAQRVRELGGRVTCVYENLPALAFTVPKESANDLLADGRVLSSHRQRQVRRAIEPISFPGLDGRLARRRPEGEEIAPMPSRTGWTVRPVPREQIAREQARGSAPVSFLGYAAITQAAQTWEAADMGEGTIVGIIDTGVYPHHPLFEGNVIGGRNLVPREEEEAIDVDGDGQPDGRWFDWDAVENDGHGTLIAGMIAGHADLLLPEDDPIAAAVLLHSPESVELDGEGGAALRLMGTAPGAQLYGIKVFPYDGGSAPDARVVEAIDQLITLKRTGQLDVDVVNMSLSGPVLFDGRNPLDAILDVATLHGITMVPAASNDGPALTSVGSPGSAYTALTAGAAYDPIHSRVAIEVLFGAPGLGSTIYPGDDRIGIIDFSSRGRTADGRLKPNLVATGFFVFSSTLSDFDGDGVNDTPFFGFASGTSLSTPTISGAAALVTAYADRTAPGYARPPYVANVLRRSAVPVDDFRSVSRWEQGAGFVHLPGAFAAIDSGRVTVPPVPVNSHVMMERLSLAGGAVSGECPDLEAGVSYNFLIDVPEDVSNVRFRFPSVSTSANQNPILGDGLSVFVHSAKRGGAGDYVFGAAPIEAGEEFDWPFPEPGTVRVTMMGFLVNYGPVSGSFEAIADFGAPLVADRTLTGRLRHDGQDEHEVVVPEGLDALAVRMAWPHDWRRIPTFDLDLFMRSPEGFHLAASIDAPELAWIEDPEPGEWTFVVVDAGTVTRRESYTVDIAFVQPVRGPDDDLAPELRPRVAGVRPNPVRASADVSFVVPRRERVQLRVYDVTGRLVRTLADANLEAGEHTARWDGRSERGRKASAGVYFVRLDTSLGSSSRKVVLLD